MKQLRTNVVLVLVLSLAASAVQAIEIGGHGSSGQAPDTREACPTLDSCTDPVQGVGGLAFDGTYLWHADDEFDMIYKLDPTDGRVIDSFPSPGGCPGDLGFDPVTGLLVVAVEAESWSTVKDMFR